MFKVTQMSSSTFLRIRVPLFTTHILKSKTELFLKKYTPLCGKNLPRELIHLIPKRGVRSHVQLHVLVSSNATMGRQRVKEIASFLIWCKRQVSCHCTSIVGSRLVFHSFSYPLRPTETCHHQRKRGTRYPRKLERTRFSRTKSSEL